MRKTVVFLLILVLASLAYSGKIVRLSIAEKYGAPNFDPHKFFEQYVYILESQIFESLFSFNKDGDLIPELAIKYERSSFTSYDFYLRKGVRFHNGEEFDSSDVVFSFKRQFDPKTGFTGAFLLPELKGVKAISKYRVRVYLKYPSIFFVNKLSALLRIIPKDTFLRMGEKKFGNSPIGTGPFVFKKYVKADGREEIHLMRNKKYWMKGYPKVDGLIFIYESNQRQFQDFLSGKIDFIYNLNPRQAKIVLRRQDKRIVRLLSYNKYCSVFNIDKEGSPLKDLRVRKAINHAVNKKSIIHLILLGNGREIATFTLEGEMANNPELKPYSYNPLLSKRLLKEAGYPNGFKMSIYIENTYPTIDIGKAIVSDLREVGIDATLIPYAPGEHIKVLVSPKYNPELPPFPYDLFVGFAPDIMNIGIFEQFLILHKNGPFNPGVFLKGGSEYSEIYDMAMRASTKEEAVKLLRKLDKFVYDNALGLFLFQIKHNYGLSKGLRFTPRKDDMLDLRDLEWAGK